VSHLGPRISALVDGELGHEARDRALAHVAHCAGCRELLESERAVKELLAAAAPPQPPVTVLASLQALAQPGNPLPPRARAMPQGPVVPTLPPPGRAPRGARGDSRGPASTGPSSGLAHRRARRARFAAVGALSVAGLVLGTAFAAGGQRQSPSPAVVPPAAELTVEHSITTSGLTFGDPGLGVASSFGDVTYPTVSRDVTGR
jgi:hypothetical protein